MPAYGRIAFFPSGTIFVWFSLLVHLVSTVTEDDPGSNELHPPMNAQCSSLNADCWNCKYPPDCKYGDTVEVTCDTKDKCSNCQGEKSFKVQAKCMYCYQTDRTVHSCEPVTNCSVTALPPDNLVQTSCTVNGNVVCMGQRRFRKRVPCQWTSGRYKWSTALILSITLGGFGADRFYLGLWRSGLGKLFSFGGLGVWTIVDVILIAVGYIGPADNSLYIY